MKKLVLYFKNGLEKIYEPLSSKENHIAVAWTGQFLSIHPWLDGLIGNSLVDNQKIIYEISTDPKYKNGLVGVRGVYNKQEVIATEHIG